MQKFYIYSLVDPRNNEVKYVGATINPKTRLLAHVSGNNSTKKKQEWLDQLQAENLKPAMEILEECDSAEAAAKREIYHYNYFNSGQLVCSNPAIHRYKFKVFGSPKKFPLTCRLTTYACDLLEYMSQQIGVTQSEYLVVLIREKAAALGITAAKS